MSDNVKPFGLKRNLDFVKEAFIIKMKVLKEYKINLYSGFLASTGFSIILLIYYSIFSSYLSGVLSWTSKDYLFCVIIAQLTALSFGSLSYGINLTNELLSGKLNIYIMRPFSVFMQYLNSSFIEEVFIMSIIYFFLLVFYLVWIYPEFVFIRLIVSLFFVLFAGVLFIVTFRMADSFSFLFKNNSFIRDYIDEVYIVYDTYPAVMFKGGLKFLSLFFANAYYGARVTEYFMGRVNFNTLFGYWVIIICLIFVFSIIIFLNWHYGLKKYEAFG